MVAEELTVREASQYADLSISYIIRLMKDGKIKGRKMGKAAWLVDKDSLDDWLKKREQERKGSTSNE